MNETASFGINNQPATVIMPTIDGTPECAVFSMFLQFLAYLLVLIYWSVHHPPPLRSPHWYAAFLAAR
ncbi:MAG: hypothetical protein POG74_02415 [Acidocella sp.]|nr:hypothetical protein [Acidocella sp.]